LPQAPKFPDILEKYVPVAALEYRATGDLAPVHSLSVDSSLYACYPVTHIAPIRGADAVSIDRALSDYCELGTEIPLRPLLGRKAAAAEGTDDAESLEEVRQSGCQDTL
jgi:hypothetical protein